MSNKLATILLITLASFCTPLIAAQIDILFLYDDHTKTRFSGNPKTALTNWVDQTNEFYKASKVDLSLRIVDVVHFNVAGSKMADVLANAQKDSWIRQKRAAVGADFVSVIHKTGDCGIGYIAVHADWAFNVVGADCGTATVLAHELGHNMGLNHSRSQGDTGGIRYQYGLGHGVNNSFGTMMTYHWLFNGKKATVFSNPDIDCYGHPCGVKEGNSQQANAAKAINQVKNELAAFQSTKIPDDSGDDDNRDDDGKDDNPGDKALANIAPTASASTSYVSSWETLSAVNDGKTPQNSNDKTDGAYGNWHNPNSIQWVRYDWPSAKKLSRSEIYWFDDDGGVLVPTQAYIEYWNGAGWVKVGDVPLAENSFNTTALNNISTMSVRVSMKNRTQSTGILEWRIFGE